MTNFVMPRYPVYIPSKGRAIATQQLTIKMLTRDHVPFKLVVEPQELDIYSQTFNIPKHEILTLPESGQGLIYVRNWIKQHSTAAGDERHWQLDDNMRDMYRVYGKKRLYCTAGVALRTCEDFVDRYSNVAIAGLNYYMFGFTGKDMPPFYVNVHVYSCTLVNNAIPHHWRSVYNDDTDICLQVLADGWCTVLINAFLVDKETTMTVKGGNTDELYGGDGRLKMARSLERLWPGVVETKRRFGRPQHVIKDAWRRFDTPLKLKPGIDLTTIPPNDYGLKLKQVGDEIKSPDLKKLYDEANKDQS